MKNILLTAGLCALSFAGQAQINVGTSRSAQANSAGRFDDGDIDRLKKTTTYFVLQKKDQEHIADFEKVLGEMWKLTKYKIIGENEMYEYAKKGDCSFFSFGMIYREVQKSSMGSHNNNMGSHNSNMGPWKLFSTHISYDLWIPKINKKDKVVPDVVYSHIIMSQDAGAIWAAKQNYGYGFSAARDFEEKMNTYIYNEASFANWGAGYLKNYLMTIIPLLEKERRVGASHRMKIRPCWLA
ncbi:hypothetical protein GCM10023093_17190 [Nemorincola caseinilytica]|uniref:Uncharacterized protein n=1 Tax=Nemorincola caseinilytica TaxID=2054315 RepID=A0ABP8NG40_9BACT